MDRLLSMRVFERVVDEGGFAAAARSLDMSAPVVTRLIADLEDSLGARLLQRTTRRQSLTEAGQAYLSRVRSILQDIDEAHAVASAHTQELAGTLRLHAPPILATHVIAPLLADFRRLYPKILIDVEVETLTEPPIEDFDITLMGTDDSFDGNVVARKVVASEAILVAAPSYVARRGTPQTPQDLSQHDCLRLKLPNGRIRLWRLWSEATPSEVEEVEVSSVITANHTDTLLRATLDGAGIASMSLDVAAPHLMHGRLVRVLAPWITAKLAMYAAMPSRKFIPQRTRVFLDFLVEQTQSQVNLAMDAMRACQEAHAGTAAAESRRHPKAV